jgi:hypothetical protein
MESHPDRTLKFVRLPMTREIVEVVGQNAADLTLNYRGEQITLSRRDVTLLTPEEEAAAVKSLSG